MKNILIILFSISIIFFSCVNATDDNSETTKYYITIKNESSFPLTNVKFLNLPFETTGNDLPVSGQASREITPELIGKSGYITFEFKNTPNVTCRTDAWLTASNNNLTFVFIDATVVEELNNSNNKKTLSQITFSRLLIERNNLSVIKNDIVKLGETVSNYISQHELTIRNTGAGKLKLIGNEPVKINGSSDVFSVIQPSSSEINQNGILTFKINFMPKAIQPYTAQVIISSDDLNGDFTFTITATGTVPKPIAVINYLTTEVDQDGTINIGEVLITQYKIFNIVIKNIGTELLTIEPDNISIIGADESAFTKITNPSGSISINSQTSFNIEFKPTKEGENNITLTIPSNDVSRNPVVVFIKGIGKKGNAVLQLTQGSTTIINNSITPLNFGQVDIGTSKPLTFTIKNTGNIALELTGEPIVSSSNTVFSITSQPANRVLNPNSEISFILLFTPSVEGETNSTITINNNTSVLQFSFNVKGTGYIKKPQITIRQNTANIAQNGEVNIGSVFYNTSKDIIFTIKNSGEADLILETVNGNRVNLIENSTGYFSIVQQPIPNAIISPEGINTFTLRFNPSTVGTNFNSVINIKSNSQNNDDFYIQIRGGGRNNYIIGDTGPGGGRIFFAQGGVHKECSADLGSYTWENAITAAKNHRGGGFSNWYLPDRGELSLMYQNLYMNGIGGFSYFDRYWTSEENNTINAHVLVFDNGKPNVLLKTIPSHVRAVRSFTN